MTENRDQATGQFAASEPLTGQAGLEHDAGFKPMPADRPKDDKSEFDGAREAADELVARRGAAIDAVEPVQYHNADDGTPTDPKETVDIDRAARDLAAYREAKADSAAKSVSADFAAQIDKARADAIKGNEKVAEHYGVEVPPEAEKTDAAQAGDVTEVADLDAAASTPPDDAIDAIEGLDPETKKALKIPQVRAALEEQFSRAEQHQQAYATALTQANAFAQAAFFEVVPELQGLSPEHMEQGLAVLAQVDPPKFKAAMGVLNRVGHIQAAQQQDQQRRAHLDKQQFEAQRQEYSRKSDEVLGLTEAEKTALAEDLVNYVGEYGVTREQLVHEAKTNLALHHPAFQKMAADALKYRQILKAKQNITAKPLPPAQRPGSGRAAAPDPSSSQIQALERELSAASPSKHARIAAQITSLRRAARG